MAERWIRRKGSAKSGFRYVDSDSAPVRDARRLQRIATLRVPPAWRDVHIAADAQHAVPAWGYDTRGRKQYRYHERAVVKRELRKYHRVRQLAKALPRIRRVLRTQSHHRELTCETACAIALRLIRESLFRPGSEKYVRENRSYGMTTLRKRHVALERDQAVFEYPGKSSKAAASVCHQRGIVAPPVASAPSTGQTAVPVPQGSTLVRPRCARRDRVPPTAAGSLCRQGLSHLGWYSASRHGAGGIRSPRSPTEAKRNVMLAMRIVSSELGNTPAICRSSYVHPMVPARYVDDGETIVLRTRKRSVADAFAHSPEERALIAFLDRHFPERRRGARVELKRAA